MNEQEIKLYLENWRGCSAYEIAVQNGFNGTQKEWLESLKGGELQLTVCGKGVDNEGNIVLHASDIKVLDGGLYTIAEKLSELDENKLEADAIVDSLESDEAQKALSAAKGKTLNKAVLKKAELFMAELTIPADGWSAEEPYIHAIAVDGVTADSGVVLTDYPDGGANEEAFAECGLKIVGRDEGVVGVRVNTIPETSFVANLLVLIPGVSE